MRNSIGILALALAACGSTAGNGSSSNSSSSGGASTGTSGGSGPTACAIGGADYPGGAVNPANPCQICQPTVSATAWSDLPAGACQQSGSSGGSSSGGSSGGGTTGGSSGASTGSSGGTSGSGCTTDGTGCGQGDVCYQGACLSGCYISGAFYTLDATNPDNPCQQCTAAALNQWANWNGPPLDAGCAVGDTCASGACCSPNCAGKCPYASDGCNGQCPVPSGPYPGCTLVAAGGADAGEGCCDANGVCQPGTATTDCTVGGACQNCTQTNNTCNLGPGGYSCCTPGLGCGDSCGDPKLVDNCGNVCPFKCPKTGCCDANLDCQPGTSDDACGSGGDAGSCVDCTLKAVSCTKLQYCGACANGAQKVDTACTGTCESGMEDCESGEWVITTACASGCLPPTLCNGTTCH